MHGARAGFSRAKWETSTHTLVEKNDDYITIKTSVLYSSWHMFNDLVYNGNREEFFRESQEQIQDIPIEYLIGEVSYYITLMGNRIERVINMCGSEWRLIY